MKLRKFLNTVGLVTEMYQKAPGKWLGLCPFHKELTPSFTLDEEAETYHCFGCGAHGNADNFSSNLESASMKRNLPQEPKEPTNEDKKHSYGLLNRILKTLNDQVDKATKERDMLEGYMKKIEKGISWQDNEK